jgi:hypothetical protein
VAVRFFRAARYAVPSWAPGVVYYRTARSVSSLALEAPGAERLGVQIGTPYAPAREWTDDELAPVLVPEAVRIAWRVWGQPLRVGVVVELVACGRRRCPYCGVDAYAHGPYLWEYRRPRRDSRAENIERRAIRSVDLGRRSPPPTLGEVFEAVHQWRSSSERLRARARWADPSQRYDARRAAGDIDEQRAELARDRALFGLEEGFTRAELRRAHARLTLIHHPDRGGSAERMAQLNMARDRLVAELERHAAAG